MQKRCASATEAAKVGANSQLGKTCDGCQGTVNSGSNDVYSQQNLDYLGIWDRISEKADCCVVY